MKIKVDEQGTVERFKTLTMDQAGVGSDEPDDLVVGSFGQVNLADVDAVDDAARLAASARPFGIEWQVDYRFCAPASDERIESVAFLLRQESDPQHRAWLEVSLGVLARFEGGTIDEALVYFAREAVKNLEHPA